MRLPGKLELPGRNLPADRYVCFALFCTAPLPLKTINQVLNKARDGTSDMFNTTWEWWLATREWEKAMAPRSAEIVDGTDQTGTETPVESFTSPFLAQDIESLAKELKAAPEEVYLNREYFGVLDERTKDDGSVVLCRIEEGGRIDWIRTVQKHSSMYLSNVVQGGADWEELVDLFNKTKREMGEDVLE